MIKSTTNYGLNFTKGFVTSVDEILKDVYSKYLPRESFLHLFYLIERGSDNENRYANYCELPRDIRNNFGRFKKDGKYFWRFVEIIKACEKHNIISSTTYSNFNDNYCKSYGFTLEFLSTVCNTEIEFIFCEVSKKTWDQINNSYTEPTDPILLKHFNTIKKLNFDLVKGNELAKQYKGERFLSIVRDIELMYYKSKIIVTTDERTGRIFSTFNLIKKELREFCTYNGEKLESLDLKSSQPYLLASLLLKENPNNEEVKRFYKLITEKDLYDWLLELWGGFEYRDYDEQRTIAKKMFFSYLYKNSNKGVNTVQELIKRHFPEIYNILTERRKKDELWASLQKIEADIFIKVGNQFVERGCLSVHDSLYFPISLRVEIETALKDRFNQLGFSNYVLK